MNLIMFVCVKAFIMDVSLVYILVNKLVKWNIHFDHAHVCLTWLIMDVSSVYNLFSIVRWNRMIKIIIVVCVNNYFYHACFIIYRFG